MEMGANGLVDLIAFTELEIVKKLQTELHMSRARDGRGSERGSRKQSCACLRSKGEKKRARFTARPCLCPSQQDTPPHSSGPHAPSLNAPSIRNEAHPSWDCSS